MILDHFVAPEGTTLVEFDYAQLEIRVLALASNDTQLVYDINNGVDMHTYFASKIYRKPEEEVTKEQRRVAKGFSFQLQYGAASKGIASFWDVPEKMAKDFIESYYTRYPGVKTWQESVQEEAESTIDQRGDRSGEESVHSCYIPSIWKDKSTGKPLTQYRTLCDVSKWSDKPYAPPTKCKNYPIQGAASDIVMLMLNRLYRLSDTHAKLVNSVHDSVLFEIPDEHLEITIPPLEKELGNVPQVIKEVFGVTSPVPFPVDYETGKTLAKVKNKA
tara:strand:- start:5197 stop:6018 length:822 start_codon:yes stop_codon:yes gene_type:complete